ncbi:MAG: ATP-dependent helicase [Candidatus Edwardsbacteria bacterium]
MADKHTYTLAPAGRSPRISHLDYSRHLNEQQLAVVTADGGPMLVLAGAGSGKTRVLIFRVAYLLEQGVNPSEILLVTFTNKAAKEMLRRVNHLLGQDIKGLWGGTFHHVGNLLLRRFAKEVGFEANFSIIDTEDARVLLEDCVEDCGISRKQTRFPKGDVLREIISQSLNCDKTVESVLEEKFPHFLGLLSQIEKVMVKYKERKQKAQVMDFDDLLINWHRLLKEFSFPKDVLIHQFHHILVDEYQDTNKLQAEIVDGMGEFYRNVLVVGDDAQSIYAFRGAEFKNILEFPKRYPDCKIYKLETNYRSSPEILNLANESIKHNLEQFQKTLQSIHPSGEKPALVTLLEAKQQAEFVAQRILELRDEGISLSQIAVLYRAHYQAADLELELRRRNIPYLIRSGLRFFEQAHIKDVIAHLRVIQNQFDELSWKRVCLLAEGVGKKTASLIWDYISGKEEPLTACFSEELKALLPKQAKVGWKNFLSRMRRVRETSPLPAEMIQTVLQEDYRQYLQENFVNFWEREEDVEQLSNFALQYESLERFLSEMALQESMSGEDIITGERVKEEELLTLSTIHRAKGLEWKVIFLIWLAEGHLPISRSYGDPAAIEEERRLFYVALTRAKRQVYLAHPISARRYGVGNVILRPSPFVTELPEDCYEKWEVEKNQGEI